MELTEEDVVEILRLIEESDFEFFRLRSGDLNLTVSKKGYVPAGFDGPASGAPVPAQAPPPQPAGEAPVPKPESGTGGAAGAQPAALPEAEARREGLTPITAPMVGTFYRAPEPGADPFVEVGGRVDADTTVGLVEVMKVFTSIPAGTAGTIAEVVAANAQFVQKGEVLYFIEPDGAP
ncbi:MAG: acetyl-CoA carboxylase biotin carboxyl carrier protein subunit [Alphaproteobacteria bacterium]|nr:acetyl-CoA carboxylase biotin carboxyl carrier protein subunit [Alphaproteobacteria bacterium]